MRKLVGSAEEDTLLPLPDRLAMARRLAAGVRVAVAVVAVGALAFATLACGCIFVRPSARATTCAEAANRTTNAIPRDRDSKFRSGHQSRQKNVRKTSGNANARGNECHSKIKRNEQHEESTARLSARVRQS